MCRGNCGHDGANARGGFRSPASTESIEIYARISHRAYPRTGARLSEPPLLARQHESESSALSADRESAFPPHVESLVACSRISSLARHCYCMAAADFRCDSSNGAGVARCGPGVAATLEV